MPTILFVNHRDQACGVQQMGQKYYRGLAQSTNYTVYYIDVDNEQEFNHWADELNPNLVLYNYYFSGATMGWLTAGKIAQQRGRFRQCTIFHEGNYDSMGFDLIFHQDPSFNGDSVNGTPVQVLTRPIPGYNTRSDYQPSNQNSAPIISSFGFGLGGKGFTTLVQQVQSEFDSAVIRLNIPYAKFGDNDGSGAKFWANAAKSLISKSGIELVVTHDLLPEPELLNWLAESDIIAFFYDQNGGRGASGTTDYALAVRKPIAITRSDQFQHIWKIDDSFVFPDHSISEILAHGVDHLEKFHNLWSADKLVESFERGFKILGV